MEAAKLQFDQLGQEEEKLQFDSFSREDAWSLGLLICEKAKKNPQPLGVEIVLNGLMVFRFYPTGITKNNQLWLERKRRTVDHREMSSLRLKAMADMKQVTLEDWKLDPAQYALDGGGYPIIIKNTGCIGSVCASGYLGREDHQIIVDAIAEYLHVTL